MKREQLATSPERLAALREQVRQMRTTLEGRLAAGDDGMGLGAAHATELGHLLGDLFQARTPHHWADRGIALVAVGSFGRGAVALRSDADVRIIVDENELEVDDATQFAEDLLYPLWDSGLSIGHQVLGASAMIDLAATDLATATSILDMRTIAGDSAIADSVRARANNGLFAEGTLAAFNGRLEAEAMGRHERFGGSLYLLEPDVKSGKGGLRDLDIARWAARARYQVSEDLGESRSRRIWFELVRLGVLVAREAQEIAQAEDFLWRVRNRLHAHAGRRSDRLTFDQQEEVGLDLGMHVPLPGPSASSPPPSVLGPDREDGEVRARAAENFMQAYYLHARVIALAFERILEKTTPARRRTRMPETDLGQGVRAFDGHVTLAGADDLARDPALALRVYAAAIRHKLPILPFARETIARAACDDGFAKDLRESPEARQLFVDLVATVEEAPVRMGSVLGEMHELGLLLAMIPEFRPVTGRVHHDVYHVYTVDVHSVAAVDYLRAMCRGEFASALPLGTRLAAEVSRRRVLFLATLLHDVGKGYPDATGSRKNHSESGALLCASILPRLGVPDDEIRDVSELVRLHLSMYHTATRRDLDDPGTIADFCRSISDRDSLRNLYLLTVADISTTSPTAMNSWKAGMLDELYFAADGYLASDGAKGKAGARVALLRQQVLERMGDDSGRAKRFLDTMPDRYFWANDADSIAAHVRASSTRAPDSVCLEFAASRHSGVFEVSVVADDEPGLLARIAGVLLANRLEVLAAEAYTRPRSDGVSAEVVDLFWVRRRDETHEVAPERLRADLQAVCSAGGDVETLIRQRTGGASPWRERPSPRVRTDVVIDERASPRHTVVEVYAKDRPGLLYTLASAFHKLGLSIALSKINTEGQKVADVFYVTELDGKKIEGADRKDAVRSALLAVLAG
jgi:[protein-PII] uridylyltransferase